MAVRLPALERRQRLPATASLVPGGALHGAPRLAVADAEGRHHGRARPDDVWLARSDVLGGDHADHRDGSRGRRVVRARRPPTRGFLRPGGLGVERDQTDPGRHADCPHVRLHGAVRVLLQHRSRPSDHGDHDLRPATAGAYGQPGHQTRSRGRRGGQQGVRIHRVTCPDRRPVAAGQALDHGRSQPDPHAGHRHGRHRRHHGRRGPRTPGLPGRPEPRHRPRHLIRSRLVGSGRRARPPLPARGGGWTEPVIPDPGCHEPPPGP